MPTPPPRKPAVPMAPAFLRSDTFNVDTSRAPWMTVAHAELGRKVRDWQGDHDFTVLLYRAVVQLRSAELGMPHGAREAAPCGVLARHDSENGRDSWPASAWCAAFVNWCLARSGAANLALGTASAWLRFGTPLPAPTYGCVVVMPPDPANGGTTCQLAFFVETKGEYAVVLGGHQRGAVATASVPSDRILGYRWPTEFSHYLQSGLPAAGG